MTERIFLVVDTNNQLGNQLFVFGTLIACAEKHHATVVNLGFHDYAGLFPTTTRDALCRYPAHSSWGLTSGRLRQWLHRTGTRLAHSAEVGRLRRLANPLVQVMRSGHDTTIDKSNAERAQLVCYLDQPEQAARLRLRRVTIFRGPLFRDMPALWEHGDKVRAYFRPPPDIGARIAAALAALRAQCDVVIGTHIRRGDYAHFVGGRYFFSFEQYQQAMRHAAALFAGQRVGFWVCSNETLPEEAFAGLHVVRGLGGILEDLYALAQCDYLIGPPSTFSGWASYYGQVPLYFIKDPAHAPALGDFRVTGSPATWAE